MCNKIRWVVWIRFPLHGRLRWHWLPPTAELHDAERMLDAFRCEHEGATRVILPENMMPTKGMPRIDFDAEMRKAK